MNEERAIVPQNEGGELITQDFQKLASDYLESLGSKLSEADRIKFIHLCKYYQLDPFKREIYGVPYGNKFNIIVGYETYLKRAEKSGLLAGWKPWVEGSIKEQNLKGCVQIYRKDWEKPFFHEVDFEEYDLANSMWRSKPKTMIKKVAMAQAFRLCFPNEFGGMPYIEEELEVQEKPKKDLTYYLSELEKIKNANHLNNWAKKHGPEIVKNLDTESYKILKNHKDAKLTMLQGGIGEPQEKAAQTEGNQQGGQKVFTCDLDGQDKTHEDCNGLDCRVYCEHFN